MQSKLFLYTFTLQTDNKKKYLLMQRLLLVIIGTLATFSIIFSWPDKKRFIFLCALIFGIAGLFAIKKMYPLFLGKAHFLEKIVGLCFGISWIAVSGYSTGLIILTLTLLFNLATADTVIKIGEKIIIKTGLIKRTYSWMELEQVILKDGLLTIDFKTNQLLQHPVGQDEAIDELAFNTFCRGNL
jgi:hypothetical protein